MNVTFDDVRGKKVKQGSSSSSEQETIEAELENIKEEAHKELKSYKGINIKKNKIGDNQ